MTTLTAYPVEIKDGVVRLADDSPLPKYAKALLIIFPDSSAFDLYHWQNGKNRSTSFSPSRQFILQSANIDDLSDEELNRIIHDARKQI